MGHLRFVVSVGHGLEGESLFKCITTEYFVALQMPFHGKKITEDFILKKIGNGYGYERSVSVPNRNDRCLVKGL